MTYALDLKLSHDQNIKELLQVNVEKTRDSLKCDRVIIYSASYLPQGIVLAESRDIKYSSILGTTINDPFLTGEHLEMYCYGLSVTIDDVYSADLSKDELKDLETLGVRSLAIAPILVANKLVAFLVAHQYSQLQPWNLEAIDFLTESAKTLGKNLLNIAKAEKQKDSNLNEQTVESHQHEHSQTIELQETGNGKGNIQPTEQKTIIQENKTSSFSEVIDKIVNEQEQADILNTTVTEVRNLLKCDRVVVYSLSQDSYGVIVAESVAVGWTKALGQFIDDPCFEARHLEKYRQGRVRAWDNVDCDDATPCFLEQLEPLEVKAKIVTPIINDGQLFGLLIAHQCSETRNWQTQEINWLAEIATQLGIMLEYTNGYTKMLAEKLNLE